MKHVRFRVDLSPVCSVGPGKVTLLETIRDSGSLSEAARTLEMSYRRAWQLLDNLNRSFEQPLTQASVGGRGGGGVSLTPLGHAVIEAYRALESEIETLAARRLALLEHAVRRESGGKPARSAVVGKVVGSARARGRAAKRP